MLVCIVTSRVPVCTLTELEDIRLHYFTAVISLNWCRSHISCKTDTFVETTEDYSLSESLGRSLYAMELYASIWVTLVLYIIDYLLGLTLDMSLDINICCNQFGDK